MTTCSLALFFSLGAGRQASPPSPPFAAILQQATAAALWTSEGLGCSCAPCQAPAY